MAKGTQYSKQFKEDAVRYRKDHPELTIRKAADRIRINIRLEKTGLHSSECKKPGKTLL